MSEIWTPAQWESLFYEMIAATIPRKGGRQVQHPVLWDGAAWGMWVLDAAKNGGVPTESFR